MLRLKIDELLFIIESASAHVHEKGYLAAVEHKDIIEYLENHPEEINFELLSKNSFAGKLLLANRDKLDYKYLCMNRNSEVLKLVHGLLNHVYEKQSTGSQNLLEHVIKVSKELSGGLSAEDKIAEFDLDFGTRDTYVVKEVDLKSIRDFDKIDTYALAKNPCNEAAHIIRNYYECVDYESILMHNPNPKAIETVMIRYFGSTYRIYNYLLKTLYKIHSPAYEKLTHPNLTELTEEFIEELNELLRLMALPFIKEEMIIPLTYMKHNSSKVCKEIYDYLHGKIKSSTKLSDRFAEIIEKVPVLHDYYQLSFSGNDRIIDMISGNEFWINLNAYSFKEYEEGKNERQPLRTFCHEKSVEKYRQWKETLHDSEHKDGRILNMFKDQITDSKFQKRRNECLLGRIRKQSLDEASVLFHNPIIAEIYRDLVNSKNKYVKEPTAPNVIMMCNCAENHTLS
jgi:hypothetical protein